MWDGERAGGELVERSRRMGSSVCLVSKGLWFSTLVSQKNQQGSFEKIVMPGPQLRLLVSGGGPRSYVLKVPRCFKV